MSFDANRWFSGKPCLLRDLDKRDTTVLKGLAISAIVFHNFFHVLGPVHENEFSFNPARFSVFVQNVVNPSTTIQSLFAFFGHFGVQVFIFLSAYGLAKAHWDDQESWSSFMRSRIRKLYPMFGLVLLFWMLLAAMHVGFFQLIRSTGVGILLTFAGVSNLVPGQGLPVVGPWWFIPFILQFYAIWPFLRKMTKRFGWPGFLLLSIASFIFSFFANPILAHHSINMGMNPIGRMQIICFGIIAARFPIRLNAFWGILAFALVILGSAEAEFSHLVSLAITVFSLWAYICVRPLLRRILVFEEVGLYSLGIFLLNGIVRVPFVYFAHTPMTQLTLGCASAMLTFLIAFFFHFLINSKVSWPIASVLGMFRNASVPPLERL